MPGLDACLAPAPHQQSDVFGGRQPGAGTAGRGDGGGRRGPTGLTTALPLEPDTDPAMTFGYSARLALEHQVRAVRGGSSMLLAPDAVNGRRTRATTLPTADDVVLALPPPRPRRDGTRRLGGVVPLDDHNRASVKKLVELLGWDASTELVARVEGNTAVIQQGRPTHTEPWLSRAKVDDVGRLTLPPNVKAALSVAVGEQVLACAVAQTAKLHLAAAADTLQAFTGVIAPEVAPEVPDDRPATTRNATRVRARPTLAD
jgi:hypothetical protein